MTNSTYTELRVEILIALSVLPQLVVQKSQQLSGEHIIDAGKQPRVLRFLSGKR